MYGTYCRLNVHVHASNRTVIRAARGKLKRNCWHDPAKREMRHAFYRTMLAYHRDARALVRQFSL